MGPSLRSAVLVAFALLPVGLIASQAVSTPAEVEAFAKALEGCTAAKAATPHLLMKNFVIDHTIGTETAGKCDYRQTMPGKMNMICGFSADARKAFAAELRNMYAGGSMRGSSSSAGPAWMKECEIELPDGKRIPAASGKGGGALPLTAPSAPR